MPALCGVFAETGVRITEVTFGRTFNDGDFNSTKIILTATVDPNETASEVIAELSKYTVKCRKRAIEVVKNGK